ncbi:hypothetical protein [Flavobacterium cerinum]|uniref:Uncharacterized protein n=1 Tax=Flavobacterium cerinum TaxID=2502784 RepID=A0ABY5IUX6_9FLAO|nr:hypothetical protein [Flavobacterium cerinum]UUC45573.1 hypothetical protein NOX80_18375 [Flavobacterium cerinum]
MEIINTEVKQSNGSQYFIFRTAMYNIYYIISYSGCSCSYIGCDYNDIEVRTIKIRYSSNGELVKKKNGGTRIRLTDQLYLHYNDLVNPNKETIDLIMEEINKHYLL